MATIFKDGEFVEENLGHGQTAETGSERKGIAGRR
jgi:hypothetical protein